LNSTDAFQSESPFTGSHSLLRLPFHTLLTLFSKSFSTFPSRYLFTIGLVTVVRLSERFTSQFRILYQVFLLLALVPLDLGTQRSFTLPFE